MCLNVRRKLKESPVSRWGRVVTMIRKCVFGFEGKSSLAKGMLGFQRLFSTELPTLSRQSHKELVMHLALYSKHYTVIILWYRNML